MANEAEEWIVSHQELLATVFLWRYDLRGEPLEIPAAYSQKSSRWSSVERFQFSDGSVIVVYNNRVWYFGIHASWHDDSSVFNMLNDEEIDIYYAYAGLLTDKREGVDGDRFRNAK